MDKISKEEYLKGLDIVERYHRQMLENMVLSMDVPAVGARISDFLSEESDISIRLHSCLVEYIKAAGDIFVERVRKKEFMKIRNAGKKSWDEFNAKRELYLYGKMYAPKM
jgi:hypothetical protein